MISTISPHSGDVPGAGVSAALPRHPQRERGALPDAARQAEVAAVPAAEAAAAERGLPLPQPLRAAVGRQLQTAAAAATTGETGER